jgi:hypothetical protein
MVNDMRKSQLALALPILMFPILMLMGCSSKQAAPTVAFQNTPAPADSPQQPNPGQETVVREVPQPAVTQPAAPARQVQQQQQSVAPPSFNLAEGTAINVRLGETLDTRTNRAGEKFTATLASPIVIDGKVMVPQGTNFFGRIGASKPSGRFKGRAVMDLRLEAFDLHGKRYAIATSAVDRVSGRHRKRNIVLIGGGAGAGASIGAIAGGPAGALIGAGAGAGAGSVGAFITGKKNVHIPVETLLHFRLRESVPL